MDDVTMVIKSATKKKLMDLDVPEEVAHLLADDRKWDDVKILNKLKVKYIMEGAGTPFPIQGYSPDLVDEVYEKIQGTWVAPVTAKPYSWDWFNPYEVQELINHYRDEDTLDKALDKIVGAPILHLGFIYRSGIDTPEKYKCPMLQLGIVESLRPEPQQGYVLEVKWIKNVIPKATAVGTPANTPPWVRDAVNRGAQHNVWDPNPTPKEWKQQNPGWKHGTGYYAPARLLHNDNYTNNKIDQMADVFVILLDDGEETMVNPSNVESFSKSFEGGWYAELGDIRSAFEEWRQGYAFDEAFQQIVPQYKRLQIQWAINWTNFDKHIGV